MDTDTQEDISRQRWLDKLWLHLFDGDSAGIMSPGQIRREHRDRDIVRQTEMAVILDAEKDINAVHQGLKTLDDTGNLIDTPPIDAVETHQIIENTLLEQNADIGIESSESMLRSAVREVSVRDLERSLNLRKLAILAETEILNTAVGVISSQPVSAEWMLRWRENAQDVFNPELQLIWARILVAEVAKPGTYSLAVLSALSHLSIEDLETMRIASKYLIGNYLYDATGRYFTAAFHQPMFELLKDMSIIVDTGTEQQWYSFRSEQTPLFDLLLVCHNKALNVTHNDPGQVLTLPVFKTTRVGRQLLALCGGESDLAYLFDLARYIKAQGFNVVLGDWVASDNLEPVFEAKMPV